MQVEATYKRSLRQLVGPVGVGYLRRAVPPGWVWAGLAVLVAAACLIELPATAAAALVASAVVVHWPRRKRPSLGYWRVMGLLVLALLAWAPEPDLLSHWFEHGLAVALLALAGGSALTHVLQARRLSRRLQHAADAMDDHSLLALLPGEAASLAQRWRAGDDSHANELAVVMHLAVMHAALAPQMQAGAVDA
ncbi:hypothetical protein GCM10027214_04420 [Stenotrophomonas tumulicola]